MRKIISFALVCMLFGCSDEVTLQEAEVKSSDNLSVAENEDSVLEENSSIKDTNIDLNNGEAVEEETVSGEKDNNFTKNNNETPDEKIEYKAIIQKEIIDSDLYEHYIEKSEETTVTSNDIVINRLDEERIELPTLENNGHLFDSDDDVEKIKLSALQNDSIIEYIEEPISSGYLVALNLRLIQEKFEALSYSLVYNDREYAFMVSERNSEYGLTVVEDTTIDNLSEATLLIMK